MNKTETDCDPFPIQNGGTIPRWLAEIAYRQYVKRYGDKQSIERIAERGGFGKAELLDYLMGDLCS